MSWAPFRPGTKKSARIAVLGLFILAVGAALEFLAVSHAQRWLSRWAFIAVMAGWAIVMFGILHGWITIFRKRGR